MSEMERLCERMNVRADVSYGNNVRTDGTEDDWKRNANPWTVRLKFQRRTLTVPFWTGVACEGEPSAADVLNCVCSDTRSGEMTFSEFCSEFGSDDDSRSAERTWRACAAMAPRVRRFLGDEFDTFAGAEH